MEDKNAGPAEVATTKIDFSEWLKSLPLNAARSPSSWPREKRRASWPRSSEFQQAGSVSCVVNWPTPGKSSSEKPIASRIHQIFCKSGRMIAASGSTARDNVPASGWASIGGGAWGKGCGGGGRRHGDHARVRPAMGGEGVCWAWRGERFKARRGPAWNNHRAWIRRRDMKFSMIMDYKGKAYFLCRTGRRTAASSNPASPTRSPSWSRSRRPRTAAGGRRPRR